MNQITWTIEELERNASDGLVVQVNWKATAGDAFDAPTTVGVVKLEQGSTFVPFEDLTKDMVISWVKSALGQSKVDEVELLLSNTLDARVNTQTILGKPWAAVQTNQLIGV
jgi:hypothetical protein